MPNCFCGTRLVRQFIDLGTCAKCSKGTKSSKAVRRCNLKVVPIDDEPEIVETRITLTPNRSLPAALAPSLALPTTLAPSRALPAVYKPIDIYDTPKVSIVTNPKAGVSACDEIIAEIYKLVLKAQSMNISRDVILKRVFDYTKPVFEPINIDSSNYINIPFTFNTNINLQNVDLKKAIVDLEILVDSARVYHSTGLISSSDALEVYKSPEINYIPGKSVYKPESLIITELTRIKTSEIAGQPTGELLHKSTGKTVKTFNYLDTPITDIRSLTKKVLAENDFHFKYDNLDKVYYDIETFNIKPEFQHQVPQFNDENAYIGICCAYHINGITGHKILYAFHLTQHKVDKAVLTSHYDGIELIIRSCDNDKAIAYEFFKMLANIQNFTICIGFNSSSKPNNFKGKAIGYDLPFLVNRCPASLTCVRSSCKMGGLKGIQISKINELAKIYFLDMAVLANGALSPAQRNSMEKFGLNEYLKIAGLPLKIEAGDYCVQQNRLSRKHHDITDLVEYCAYDAIALDKLNCKMGALDKLLSFGELLNLPLSHTLYNTQPSNLETFLLKMFVKENYLVSYVVIEERLKYQGAYTYTNLDAIGKVFDNVADLDFQSLYPSAIIHGNLSPDTLAESHHRDETTERFDETTERFDETTRCFEIDDKTLPAGTRYNFVKSTERRGIIPAFLESMLEKRKQIKAIMKVATPDEYRLLDIKQYAIKIAMNTIYGLMGSSCRIYSHPCAVTCTDLGRKCLKTTINHYKEITNLDPILCDTDSIMAVFPGGTNQVAELAKYVATTMGKEFVLLHEASFDKYMPSPAKKSYLGLCEGKLVAKGISWSRFSNDAKEIQRQLFIDILKSGNPFRTVQAFYRFHTQNISTIIHADDWRERISQYCTLIKLSGKSKTVLSLLNRYPEINEDRVFTIEKVGKGSVADLTHIITDPMLKAEEINTEKLLKMFMSSICKLTIKQKALKDNEIPIDEQVHYRTETYSNGFVTQERDLTLSVHDFIELITPEQVILSRTSTIGNVAYHEVFQAGRAYRLFVDADHCSASDLEQLLAKISTNIHGEVQWVKTVSGSDSFHAISNVSMPIDQMYNFMRIYKAEFKFIDLSIYAAGRSLRAPFSPKISINLKTINKTKVHTVGNLDWLDVQDKFIVSNIDDTIPFNEIRFNNTPLYDVSSTNLAANHVTENYLEETHKWLKSLDIPEYEFSISGIYMTLRFTNGFMCPICHESHTKMQPSIIMGHKRAVFRCWSATKTVFVDMSGVTKFTNKSQIIRLSELGNEMMKETHNFDAINSAGDLNMDMPRSPLVAIKSSVGTGKTKMLEKYIMTLPPDAIVVMISFRRSFTRALATKLGFVSYMDVNGPIDIRVHKRIIVQIDSLSRIKFDARYPTVLILDEVCSLLLQTNSSLNKNQVQTFQILAMLLAKSEKIIAMDAFLSPEIITALESISGRQANTIINEYKPYSTDVDVYIGTSKKLVAKAYNSVSKLKITAKVGIFCTGVNNAIILEELLRKDGRRVLCLHGKDTMVVEHNGEERLMTDLKNQYFSNPESILQDCDVIIYTGTLTAGVSIEKIPVELMIGIYSRKTVSPLAFVQGLFRIRSREKTEIYFAPGSDDNDSSKRSPAYHYSILEANGAVANNVADLIATAKAMNSQMQIDREALLFKFLGSDLGYTITLVDCETDPLLVKTDLVMIEPLFTAKYIPTKADFELYDAWDGVRVLPEELRKTIDRSTHGKMNFIQVLECYELREKPESIYERCKNIDEFLMYYNHRFNYRKYITFIRKQDIKNLTEYDAEKHGITIRELKELQAAVVYNNMLVSRNINIERETQNKKLAELILAIEKSKVEGIISAESLLKLQKNPVIKALITTSGKYFVRDLNTELAKMCYKLDRKVVKVDKKCVSSYLLIKLVE